MSKIETNEEIGNLAKLSGQEDIANKDFSKEYSDDNFWDKVKGFAKIIGENVLEPALKLHYAYKDSDTPAWAKTAMVGALGYLISPIDAIPDVVPVVGYTDDFGVLVAAVALVAGSIKDKHKKKAKEILKEWFGAS